MFQTTCVRKALTALFLISKMEAKVWVRDYSILDIKNCPTTTSILLPKTNHANTNFSQILLVAMTAYKRVPRLSSDVAKANVEFLSV